MLSRSVTSMTSLCVSTYVTCMLTLANRRYLRNDAPRAIALLERRSSAFEHFLAATGDIHYNTTSAPVETGDLRLQIKQTTTRRTLRAVGRKTLGDHPSNTGATTSYERNTSLEVEQARHMEGGCHRGGLSTGSREEALRKQRLEPGTCPFLEGLLCLPDRILRGVVTDEPSCGLRFVSGRNRF